MKYLIFLGSARTSTPPRPMRLGERVVKACLWLSQQAENEVEIIDPLDYDFGPVFKPQFSYAEGCAPADLDLLAKKISAADGYIMVSPEYNHSMSPALAHMLNHFGSSLFAFKPSAIVTYSAGQWGGVRAATGMRVFLSELGCLPVSAMVHIPKAHEVLASDGTFLSDAEKSRWMQYIGRTLEQLDWWAGAARVKKQATGVEGLSPAFTREASQRNAP